VIDTRHNMRQLFFVVLVSAVSVLVLAVRVEPFATNQLNDAVIYIAMAEAPLAHHPAPFCFRLLVPTLAGLLPLDLSTSFHLLTFLFCTGTGVLLYYVLLELGLDGFFALMGLLLFYGLNWATRMVLFDFRLTDPGLFFFGALSFLSLLKGWNVCAVVALSLGVLAKESTLCLIPLSYSLRARRVVDPPAMLRGLAIAIIPMAVFFVVRWVIPGEFNVVAFLWKMGSKRLEGGMLGLLRAGTLGTWGVALLMLLPFSGRQGRDLAVRSIPFLVLVYAQPFFDRLLVLGFLAVVPIGVMGLRRVREKFQLSRWMVVGYAAVPFALLLAKSSRNFNPPSPEQTLLVLLIWTTIVLTAKRVRRGSIVSPSRPL
jgi:hypothetical protein